MNKRRCAGNSLFCLLLMILASHRTAAQLVATKDLVNIATVAVLPPKSAQETPPEPVTPTPDNKEKRDCVIGFRDGEVVSEVPEKLRLEIVSVNPQVMNRGTTVIVTIRLKNVGASSVLVPWEKPPVKPDADPKTGNTSTEIANIHLSFATQEDRRSSSYLKGDAILAAAPSNRAQHTELLPGQWVEVRFKAAIECYSSDPSACQPLPGSGQAELTAHWWEWLSTHEEEGCNVWRGEYESRKVDSEPLPVVYVATSPSDDKKSVPHR